METQYEGGEGSWTLCVRGWNDSRGFRLSAFRKAYNKIYSWWIIHARVYLFLCYEHALKSVVDYQKFRHSPAFLWSDVNINKYISLVRISSLPVSDYTLHFERSNK